MRKWYEIETHRLENHMSRIALISLFTLGIASSFASDWPQYRGPNADGTSPETGILKTWPKEGPRQVWKIDKLGESFGSFAVVKDKAFIFVERGGDEVCLGLEAATGKELWATPIDKTIFEKAGGNGPRSTPTISEGHVYVLGTYLKLACLNAADGKVIWKKDLAADAGGEIQLKTAGIVNWGGSASPVIEGNTIFVHGGGAASSILGIDKKTGNVLWKGTDELLTHATPTPATIHGVRQVVFFTKSGLVSVAAKDGAVLWRHPFKWATSTASSPIVDGDIVFCSAGYGVGGGAARVTKTGETFSAKELWMTPGNDMANHWTTGIAKDGYLYAIFGFKNFVKPPNVGAPLKCIELATGKEMWSKPGFGSGGGTIMIDGHILVQSDAGAISLVEATPKEFKEVVRAQPLSGKCWTMAIVANGKIYARSDKVGICLDISGK